MYASSSEILKRHVRRCLLQERPNARVLLLCPNALRHRFAEMLNDARVPHLLVDRYVFREMLDSASGREIWPTGQVAVLSIDFAKQPDVLDSLALCHWDTVFVDEWHLTRGVRMEAFRHIAGSAERIVLASATPPELEPSGPISAGNTTLVEWRRDRVVDYEGNALAPQPVVHEISFSLNDAELRVVVAVSDVVKILSHDAGAKSVKSMTILRSLESSPAALERALQNLVAGGAPSERMEEPTDFLERP